MSTATGGIEETEMGFWRSGNGGQDTREQRAAALDREARAEDGRATEKLGWAVSETQEGRPAHGRMWASQGHAHTQTADQLRKQAAEVRSGRG